MAFSLAFLALVIERLVGYPQWLVRGIGHPVMWIGALIESLEHRLNRSDLDFSARRRNGVLAFIALLAATLMVSFLIERSVLLLPFGILLLAVVASSLIAQKSLESHVRAVAIALETGGIEAGRKAVSMIVGRDPDQLDEAGVSRAAIESLAENFSDGITAPALWLGLLGLPGAALYKATNTADSMIGHRNARYGAFGWAAARFDDLVNLPASRLTALLFIAAACLVPGTSPRGAWAAVRRDAGKHKSPNAGWPEAAMAGALGLGLAGPRIYDGVLVEDHVMGEGGRRAATAEDIMRALSLSRIADLLLIILFGLLADGLTALW
ncbi:adenosylcobinamide-phosphate synthase CbiB [Rhizobium sp. SSA_523]|uniref:adenosylcobinamide-phosphate synthase CbiB n=1 Tax=Rhizobium sp. SSA_523 TaxID=2952477 RepID=UPI002091C09D|nr:adenosylcobinamide-phosphate synthase CbiB [Rhizobium sp. SSA_523]MCO5734519.1 adenosylcobinamide-phosphate synthase CbiB [Rhizobium sp. SSA_523]WKC23239.1 adenosylcobinamide-phosphate synthase CbiB [Rhizobium sp. SSA_523]